MGVSGALRIKEKKRMNKKTELSCVHLERNNSRLNGWMILEFESRIPNTLMHMIPKLQLDPTVELGDMGLQSGLICTGMSEKSPSLLGLDLSSCFVDLGFPSWIWAFILGSWQRTS